MGSLMKRDQKVGVMTASASSLTEAHFEATGGAGVPVAVAGMDDAREFTEVIVEGRRERLDFTRLESEFLSAAKGLVETDPSVGAIVLECTDMCRWRCSSYLADLIDLITDFAPNEGRFLSVAQLCE